MEPNSIVLVVALVLGAAGALVALVRYRPLVVRVLAGVIALALAATAGVAGVNDYYGYYQTWSQLAADLSGNYTSFAGTAVTSRAVGGVTSGKLEVVTLPGARSGITRRGFVYLPPQYFQARFAHTAFPVVELLHGTPGNPTAWFVHLNVVAIVDRLIAEHRMGPTILVMPTMSVGRDYEECVNATGKLDDTYVTVDVRSDVLARFRASPVPAEWGVAGYSSGGYCAANLALRHRAAFGAAGVMDGYFRPQDGPAAAALHFDAAAESANDPLRSAAALARNVHPLPAFWLSAGTGVAVDINGALAFTRALHGVEQVPLFREPNAGHNFYAWQPAVPHLLSWMWTQLAPPALRVQFPIAGGVHDAIIAARHPRVRHSGVRHSGVRRTPAVSAGPRRPRHRLLHR